MYNTTEQESARTVGIFLQLASNSYPFIEDSPFESIWDDWNTFEISPRLPWTLLSFRLIPCTLQTTDMKFSVPHPPKSSNYSFPTAPWEGSMLAGM